MALRHKDFGAALHIPAEPVTFSIAGEKFICRPAIHGYAILQFMEKTGSGDGQVSASAIIDFFKVALTDKSLKDFESLCEDPDRPVDLQQLLEIAGWLVEEFSERPLDIAKKSSGGPRKTSRASTVSS